MSPEFDREWRAMLSTMREKTKVVMIVLAVAFVGWLVFDVGMGVSGRGQTRTPDVGSVNGVPIRYTAFIEAYRQASEQARTQNPGAALTLEDQQSLENQAFEALVQNELLREEYRRRGVSVSDREIVEAVRRYPPQEIQSSPDFQTDGRFDPVKYERFLTSPNAQTRQFLIAMEQRYREELPRIKLLEQVTSDVYVSDAKLWTMWRDQHESVTVRVLAIRPATAVSEADVRVSDEDLRRYYEAHRDDFRRQARAVLSFVAVAKLPTRVDSAMVVERARALRDSILHGADFAALARTESADTASAARGGSLGTFGRGQMTPPFEEAAWRVPLGQVSELVITGYGVHLIEVERRTADSVTARHILIPWARIGARLDTLEARADSLDRFAAGQTDGAMLDTVARWMGLGVERGPPLYERVPYVLGRYRIPNVGIWAFRTPVGETSDVIETNGAYYVFRLDSVAAAGVPPLDEVRAQVRLAVTREKRREAAQRIARDAEQRLTSGQTFDQVGQSLNLTLTTLGPFTRASRVPLLGPASAAVGTAFRLRVGERSPLLSNEEAFYFLEVARRVSADSAAWATQKEQQRATVIRAARQARVQLYLEGLRRGATVKDRRNEVLRPVQRGAADGR